jgi:hypothetical protein
MNDHDLITAMRESFTDVQSATPVEQIVSRSQVIRARRRIPGAVAVAAAAAAAGIAIALISSGPARPAPAATQTTAYVVSHVAQAIDAMPDNTVVFSQLTTVPASQTFDSWRSPNGEGRSRLESFTRAGQPISDSGISFSGPVTRLTRHIVDVDYQNKTWWRVADYFGNGRSEPRVWNCSTARTDAINGNPREMADQLHTLLSCGELKVAGSGTVDGVPTVKLSGDFLGGPAVTYWVNATTYLPFRFTAPRGGGAPTLQVNLQWLPPTAANLAKETVPIPAGFTQVPPPGNAPSP